MISGFEKHSTANQFIKITKYSLFGSTLSNNLDGISLNRRGPRPTGIKTVEEKASLKNMRVNVYKIREILLVWNCEEHNISLLEKR